jgi:3-hydroxyacyl-CoA dehydrogenase
VRFPSAEAVRGVEDLGERLRALVAGDDRVANFLWPLLRDFLIYSAQMVPEISDRIVEIDRAMRWGFAFRIGAVRAVGRARRGTDGGAHAREGCAVPERVERMLASGARRSTRRRIATGSRARAISTFSAGRGRNWSRGRACWC